MQFLRDFPSRAVVAGIAATVLILCAHIAPVRADEVVAKVNGVELTDEDIAMALDDIGDSLPQMSDAEKRNYVVTYLADLELVSQAAREAGIADEAEFQRRMEYVRKRNLMERYLAREGEAAATAEAAQTLYEEVIKDIPEEQRVHASHILVETEEEAKDIHDQLVGGADFAELAKEKSKDPGSGANGGDLGWFTAEEMVPEFAEAAFALEPGELSEPVKSDFGWHLIRVEDKRSKPGFDEVEDQIYEMLARQKQRDIVLSLRQTAEIERLDQPDDAGEPEADGEEKAPE